MQILIVLGGEAPSVALLRSQAAQAQILLCADSGLDIALVAGVHVDMAIGDFDSAGPVARDALANGLVPKLTLPAEKDDTDGMAAMRYALAKHPERIVILGGGGGRIDHHMANFQLLVFARQNGCEAMMLEETTCIWAVNDTLNVRGKQGQLLSFVQLSPDLCLSLTGLHYPLDHYPVQWGYPIGVSNVLTGDEAQVQVHSGWALVIHHCR